MSQLKPGEPAVSISKVMRKGRGGAGLPLEGRSSLACQGMLHVRANHRCLGLAVWMLL